jgi:DeoR family fructose operon transcriptional repressor
VRDFRADQAFLGRHAIDIKSGFTTDFFPEIMTDQAIMSISCQVIILADQTKIECVRSALIAPGTSGNVIVSDDGIWPDCVEPLTEKGVPVIVD